MDRIESIARIAGGHITFNTFQNQKKCQLDLFLFQTNHKHKISTKKICMIYFRCQEVYGEHVNIHEGHLCGGTLNGKGGTCVGK